jgi:hypothetical protein
MPFPEAAMMVFFAAATGINVLGKMDLFPLFMPACCLALMACFKTSGGHRPIQIGAAVAGQQSGAEAAAGLKR